MQAILEFGAHQGYLLGLVLDYADRPARRPGELAVIDALSTHLESSRRVSEWPGTRIVGERQAILLHYRLAEGVVGQIHSIQPSLYSWQAPLLPIDLHIVRQDGSVFLGNVASESDGWIEGTSAEVEQLISDSSEFEELLFAKRSSIGE